MSYSSFTNFIMPPDPAWRKSSASTADGNNCVEVRMVRASALSPSKFEVRNSKAPLGCTLTFTPDEWAAFLEGVKAGEFD
jgi:hypothetical protein